MNPATASSRSRVGSRAILAGLTALLLCFSALSSARPTRARAASRPNILIILLDDQRDQGTLDVMPNTRRIFQDGGVTYQNAYDSTPLCCPARGSLWSGQYSHNHGVLANAEPEAESLYDQHKTLQYYLTQAGYMNALVGKYWNTWPRTTPPPYFQKYTMMTGGYQDVMFNVDGAQKRLNGYTTDVLGNVSVGYLDSFESNDDQPWFLYVAPHAPHDQYIPSSKYANAAVPAWQQNASVLESDLTDKPAQVRNVRQPLATIEQIRAQQLRTLMSVDDMVQQIFAEVDRLGEQDTIAFYLSDNGYFWGEHGGLKEKRMPYTEDVSIPMLARWPGHMTPGTVDPRLVAQIDIEPTVLETLGITPTHSIDGVSLFGSGARERMFLEYTRSTDSPNVPSWGADLTPTYEYAEWFNDDGSLYFREYYNLVTDPLELTNLFADGNAGNDPAIAPLHAQLAADRVCAGASCPRPATTPDTSPPTIPGRPTATSTLPGVVDLVWQASTDDRATALSYGVFRDGQAAPVGTVVSSSTSSVSFSETGLVGGSAHTYAVSANDGTNTGALSPASAPVTVASPPAVIFADDFSAGMNAWSDVTGITIASTVGGVAPPSALASTTGSRVEAVRLLGGSYGTVCVSTRVRINSMGSSAAALFHMETATDGHIGRVSLSPGRVLFIRGDVSGLSRYSTGALALGTWYTVELCGTVGTSGTWSLYLNGTRIVGPWTTDNGTTPFGSLHLSENSGKTYSMNFDDVVIDDHAG